MLSAKYCMVTGGNTGVGKETVKVRFARAGVITERRSTLLILIYRHFSNTTRKSTSPHVQ
jgi:short-subunit dehydrogenase